MLRILIVMALFTFLFISATLYYIALSDLHRRNDILKILLAHKDEKLFLSDIREKSGGRLQSIPVLVVTLSKMKSEGLVNFAQIPQPGKPNHEGALHRYAYFLTEDGKHLARRLST